MSFDTKNKILAIGDCNTLGVGKLTGHSYPERVGQILKVPVTNSGYTMSTTREGCFLLSDHLTTDCTIVIIQFGLADSYLTLRHAPYVLNYPDNILRKPFRNILKKLKKLSRKYGINKRFGESNVVPLEEYSLNIHRLRCARAERFFCPKQFRIMTPPEMIRSSATTENLPLSLHNMTTVIW